jgi:hypothetical protein
MLLENLNNLSIFQCRRIQTMIRARSTNIVTPSPGIKQSQSSRKTIKSTNFDKFMLYLTDVVDWNILHLYNESIFLRWMCYKEPNHSIIQHSNLVTGIRAFKKLTNAELSRSPITKTIKSFSIINNFDYLLISQVEFTKFQLMLVTGILNPLFSVFKVKPLFSSFSTGTLCKF